MSHAEEPITTPSSGAAREGRRPAAAGVGALPAMWRASSRAQQARESTYAELRRLHSAAACDPDGHDAELENHRRRVLPDVLEGVATAAEDLIAALVAEGHRSARVPLPGRVARWWRHRRGEQVPGPLGVALAELAATFADPWTAREVGAVISCGEIDALAWVLDLAGHSDQACALLCEHARTDDQGDPHAALRPLPHRTDPAPSCPQLLAARAHLGGLRHTRLRR